MGPWAQGPWAQGRSALVGETERQQFLEASHTPSQAAPSDRKKLFQDPPHLDKCYEKHDAIGLHMLCEAFVHNRGNTCQGTWAHGPRAHGPSDLGPWAEGPRPMGPGPRARRPMHPGPGAQGPGPTGSWAHGPMWDARNAKHSPNRPTPRTFVAEISRSGKPLTWTCAQVFGPRRVRSCAT